MMKNFYEDTIDNNDIEDISSGRFDFEDGADSLNRKPTEKKSSKIEKPPHIPGVQPSVRFRNNTVQPQPQPEAPAYPPHYGQYPAPQPGQAQPDAQGYPYYQQGYYAQPFMPPQYVPYGTQPPPIVPTGYYAPPQYPAQPPVTDNNKSGTPNPGTKVLYQSEDFDRNENDSFEGYDSPGSYTGITHEDVIFEEEVVTLPKSQKKNAVPVIKRPPSSFTEDEMEIGTFELDAIALKHTSKAKVIKHVAKQRVPVTTDVNVDEYESYFNQQKPNEDAGKKKKKKVSNGEKVRRTVLAVSIVLIVVSCGMLLNEYRLSKENDEVMQDVENLIIDVTSEVEVTEQEESTTKKKSDKKNDKNKTTDKAQQDKQTTVLTEQQQWQQLKAQYPNVVFPANLQLKYAKLYATNQDFAGYLSAEGVGLSLPVVQTKDSEDQEYMQKNFYGNKTKYGCPFVTHLNNLSPLDMNTVIFGHHMNNGTVFGALDQYKSIEGFKKAPVISFNTMSEDYNWKVIAAFVTNAYPEEDNGYIFRYYFTNLSTTERYASFLSELSQRSLYDTGVDVLPTDKILTLSTCSHEFNEARFVVVARLVRKGESTDVDVSRASVNDNPRYPQAYYDKKNKTNPYADAYRWEVG